MPETPEKPVDIGVYRAVGGKLYADYQIIQKKAKLTSVGSLPLEADEYNVSF